MAAAQSRQFEWTHWPLGNLRTTPLRFFLGQGQLVRAHLHECCKPVIDDPEEIVEVLVAFVQCKARTSQVIHINNTGAAARIDAVLWARELLAA